MNAIGHRPKSMSATRSGPPEGLRSLLTSYAGTDFPHDDPAIDRGGGHLEGEALAVTVGPGGPDFRPAAGLAVAAHDVEVMRRLGLNE